MPPDLCAFARWDGGLRAVFVENLVAFPLIVAAIGADLLDLSRITNGKIELRKERLDVATVVGEALEVSRPLAQAAGHELAVALPPRPALVYGDRARLTQVIANLLNNSVKFTGPGGRIWLTVERQGSDVAVKVKDTGVGAAQDTTTPNLRNINGTVTGVSLWQYGGTELRSTNDPGTTSTVSFGVFITPPPSKQK